MRLLAGLFSLLTFPLVLACSPPQTVAPHEPELIFDEPAVFVEQRSPALAGVVEWGPSCPAELAHAPTAFFREQVLLRLPLGIEGEQVPTQTFLARSARPLAMGCEPKLAASVFVSRIPAATDDRLEWARERLFFNLDFPSEREIVVMRGSDADADVTMSISFPDHAAWGPTRVYLRMFARHGHLHAVGFIAERGSYHQLEPVFAASAASLLAVPQ